MSLHLRRIWSNNFTKLGSFKTCLNVIFQLLETLVKENVSKVFIYFRKVMFIYDNVWARYLVNIGLKVIKKLAVQKCYHSFHKSFYKLLFNIQTRFKRTQFGKIVRSNSTYVERHSTGPLTIFPTLKDELSSCYPVTRHSH